MSPGTVDRTGRNDNYVAGGGKVDVDSQTFVIYKCPYCGKTFPTFYRFYAHMTTVHRDKIDAEIAMTTGVYPTMEETRLSYIHEHRVKEAEEHGLSLEEIEGKKKKKEEKEERRKKERKIIVWLDENTKIEARDWETAVFNIIEYFRDINVIPKDKEILPEDFRDFMVAYLQRAGYKISPRCQYRTLLKKMVEAGLIYKVEEVK